MLYLFLTENNALKITEFRSELLEKYENFKSSYLILYIVVEMMSLFCLEKSVPNVFVFYEVSVLIRCSFCESLLFTHQGQQYDFIQP